MPTLCLKSVLYQYCLVAGIVTRRCVNNFLSFVPHCLSKLSTQPTRAQSSLCSPPFQVHGKCSCQSGWRPTLARLSANLSNLRLSRVCEEPVKSLSRVCQESSTRPGRLVKRHMRGPVKDACSSLSKPGSTGGVAETNNFVDSLGDFCLLTFPEDWY